jgi:TolB-like protein/DNA-binding winged helix-turn-helix (wHTH) protein/Flp pilus assembly protein TadD
MRDSPSLECRSPDNWRSREDLTRSVPHRLLPGKTTGDTLAVIEVDVSVTVEQHPHRRFRFGVFELDLRAGELRKHGLRVRLQEQPVRVLATLLAHAGEIVSREKLREELWSADTFVDFDHGLNKAINKIREALGDSAESPRFVETVARRGYRFIADVKVTDATASPEPEIECEGSSHNNDRELAEVADKPRPANDPTSSLIWRVGAGALVLVVAALVLWKVHFWNPGHPVIRSLAVLPLESLSSDQSQDYFADGMTDELISDLGQISALRVISRTSAMGYKHARKPLPQIARELNVDAVVEGTVLRSGDQVRITAQLIEAATDRHLWSQSYEGELRDTLVLQNKVAKAIAEQIRINLNPQEQAALKKDKIVDPQAYESYLKGRYFWNKRTPDGLQAARAYFDQAIEEDPTYPQAYSGLADTYALLGDWQYAVMPPKEALPKAKAAASKALQLDSGLGEAHNSLAFCLDGFDWDFDSAGKEFQRATDLNPSYATAHHWYAWHLSLVGRNAEAILEMRKAVSLDPLSLIINVDLAELLTLAHSYDESIRQSKKVIEMDADFALAHNQLGQAYLEKRMNDEAVAELQKAVQLSAGCPTCLANLARAYAASGRKSEAEKILRDLKSRSNPNSSLVPEIATIYVALDDREQAMEWLEKGYEERFNPGVLLRPGFDPIRTDPRFQDLMQRIGIPH